MIPRSTRNSVRVGSLCLLIQRIQLLQNAIEVWNHFLWKRAHWWKYQKAMPNCQVKHVPSVPAHWKPCSESFVWLWLCCRLITKEIWSRCPLQLHKSFKKFGSKSVIQSLDQEFVRAWVLLHTSTGAAEAGCAGPQLRHVTLSSLRRTTPVRGMPSVFGSHRWWQTCFGYTHAHRPRLQYVTTNKYCSLK